MIRQSVRTGRPFAASSIHREVIQAQGHSGSNQNCTSSCGCPVMPAATACGVGVIPAQDRGQRNCRARLPIWPAPHRDAAGGGQVTVPPGQALCHTSCVRAIVLNSFAGLDGLELVQIPDPVPRDGEQLVKVRAASLGPWDRYSTEGAFVAIGGSSEFPQVQGWDFAGETIDGRRVLGFVPQPWMGVGAFAEQIAVPSAILAPLPEGLGFPEGSTLPVCGLTARLLVEAAAVSGGDVVLVTGAAGMVGGFAVQLARGRGARVVAAVRERQAGEARRLGAETVVDTGTE